MVLQGRQFKVYMPKQSSEWGAQSSQKALNHALLKYFIRIKLKDLMLKTKKSENPSTRGAWVGACMEFFSLCRWAYRQNFVLSDSILAPANSTQFPLVPGSSTLSSSFFPVSFCISAWAFASFPCSPHHCASPWLLSALFSSGSSRCLLRWCLLDLSTFSCYFWYF